MLRSVYKNLQFVLLLTALFPAAALRAQEIRLYNRSVNDVAVDSDDLVWAATEDGLACFDGIDTRTFLKQTDALPSNLFNSVLADRTGPYIWAGLQKGGLVRYDKESDSFVCYRAGVGPDSLSDDDITHVEQASDGSIWASTFAAGINRLDPESGTVTRYNAETFPGYRDAPLHTFILQGDKLILGYWSDGVSVLSLLDHSRLDLRHDPSDPHSLPSDEVRSLLVDSQGRLWVGTGRGLALYNSAGQNFMLFGSRETRPGLLPATEIFDLEEDSQGRLIVAAGPAGIFALDIREAGALPADAAFIQLLGFQERDRNEVRSVEPDRFGNFWVGTYGEGLMFSSGRQPGAGQMPSELPVKNRIIGGVEARVTLEDGLLTWVGYDGGLLCLDRPSGRIKQRYTYSDGLPDSLVRALTKDRSDHLWVGTYGRGVGVFDADMRPIAHYDVNSALGSDSVNQLLCDSQGKVWAATTAGLACFSQGPSVTPELYTCQDGLSDENIRALAEDAAGNLWMSTNSEIICRTADGRFISFDQRDGLPDGNYYSADVSVTPEGRILFGGTDGIGWVDPEVLLAAEPLPPVAFLTPASKLSVGYRENYLRVRFCVPDYAFSRDVEYAYRIPDLDPEWHLCGKEVEFNHLPFGRHTLQVRARLHSQPWDAENFSSTVMTVTPPFWRTWWAGGLYILFGVAALVAVAIYLIRRLARKNRERLQRDRLLQDRQVNEERMVFYTNITHELRTPLTLILGPLDDLSVDPTIPSAARGRIGKVRQSASELLGLVNQILEFRKTETRNRQLSVSYASLSACVEEVGTRFRDLSVDPSVTFSLSVEPDVSLWFDKEAVTIILNNLLSNARKYTPSGRIVLSLQRRGDKVAVSVSDTGCGIAPEDLEHIFERYYQVKGPHQASGTGVGLALVKNLCDLHHIGLQATSEPGRGSEFLLLFDPAEDYPEALRTGPAPVVEEPEPEMPEEGDGLKVLVVEDNADIRDYIRDSLAATYTVLSASHGRDALKIAVREIPDVIVSDIMMPVMDGIAFCKAVRQDVRTSHIPVILLTAKGSDEARTEGYEVGADSYLVKPFNKSLLLTRIKNLLDKRDRTMRQVSESGSAEDLSPVDNDFLERYTQFVTEHLGDEKIDIVSLASEFAMSQSTLYRKVKAVSGLSPNELVRNIRLNRAAEMLAKSDLTVSEISWQTGFGSPVYFRTCFKERYGKTPSEWRVQARKK
ncbi:MAG: response regulator [Bacteroidales bacterium]|nr:response regulator [Bacteroidales bacterium]